MSRPPSAGNRSARARLAAAGAAGAAALVLYLASLQRGVAYWDTADFQTVPYILGIPYPTGFPGFVLLGWVWSHVLPFGDVATRMNALSAVAVALMTAVVAGMALELGATSFVAVASALLFATARAPWMHAAFIDAHTVGAAAVALALLFALRVALSGRTADLVLCVLASAAAIAIDDTTVLCFPGIAVVVLFRRRSRVSRRAVASALALGLLVVAGAYAYLPIRSAVVTRARLDPELTLGLPPGLPSAWDYYHPATFSGFIAEVTGWEFKPDRGLSGALRPDAFRRLAREYVPAIVRDFSYPVLALALVGAVLALLGRPVVAIGLISSAGIPLLFAFGYPIEADRVRYEFIAYAVIAALPTVAMLECARRVRSRWVSSAFGVVLLAAAVAGVRANLDLLGHHTSGADFLIGRVRAFTPQDAILVADWNFATPLAYAGFVEHSLGDRIVVTGDPDQFREFFPGWLTRRPVVFVTVARFDSRKLRVRRLDDFGNPALLRIEMR